KRHGDNRVGFTADQDSDGDANNEQTHDGQTQGSLHTTFPFTLLALSQRQLTHCVRRNEMQKRCIRSPSRTFHITCPQYLTNRKPTSDLHIFCEYAAQCFATIR